MDRVELKTDAKDKLKNLWAEAIKITLLLFGISFGISFIISIMVFSVYGIANGGYDADAIKSLSDILSNLLEIVLTALFTFGYTSFFLKVSRGEEVTYKELFSKTNMWLKFICVSFLTGIVVMLGFICFIIPGIILALGLSQTILILLDDPEMDVIEAMKKSWAIMKGYKMDYFVLGLSFIGWAILCVFTLGIGFLWLIPYIQVTECNFYNKLKEKAE